MSEPEHRVRTLLDAGELAAIARRLGREIKRDYPDGVVLIALLKGCKSDRLVILKYPRSFS